MTGMKTSRSILAGNHRDRRWELGHSAPKKLRRLKAFGAFRTFRCATWPSACTPESVRAGAMDFGFDAEDFIRDTLQFALKPFAH